MAKIEIIIYGDPSHIIHTKKEGFINTKKIFQIIQKNEKYKNIQEEQIEFIRYLTKINNQKNEAWVLLNENDILKIENDLKILVQLDDDFLDEENISKKEEMLRKIFSIKEKADEEILKLNKIKNMKIKDSRPSRTFYTETKKNFENEDEYTKDIEKENGKDNSFYNDDNDLADIIVLTSNPLIDKQVDPNALKDDFQTINEEININNKKDNVLKKKDGKILSTMNDFNSITYAIYKAVLDCNKQIKASFLPLTKNNLKFAISQKPKILHLLFKSVYELENNNNDNNINNNNIEKNKYSVNLLFENEECGIKRINQNDLKTIFNSLDKSIFKNINLFICTPLSEEVFEMVNDNENYNFKNIIVQHTTLADVSFISELNEQLYKYIIEVNKPISDALNYAKKDSINAIHQFCCCFHKHKDDCEFKINISNEFYYEPNLYIDKNPHFNHLRYKCDCKFKNFCLHEKNCDNYIFNRFIKKMNIINNNICCCCSKKNHDLENIFFCKFSDNNERIFSNYQTNNYGSIIKKEFVPNYNKMKLIIGSNLIVYKIFEFLNNKSYHILNICCKQYQESTDEIDLLIDIIMEFLKERIPYLKRKFYEYFKKIFQNYKNSNDSNDNLILQRSISSINLNKGLENFKNDDYNKTNSFKSKNSNLNLFPSESAPLLINDTNSIPIFEKINNNNQIIIDDINNFKNKVYFINGFKIGYNEIFNKEGIFQSKIILFNGKELNLNNSNKSEIYNFSFDLLNESDDDEYYYYYQIKFQNKKIIYNKNDFEANIEQLKEDYKAKSIFLDEQDNNAKNDLIYEILFLFNCSNSGLFEMELKALYPENLNEIINIIDNIFIRKYIIKRQKEKDYCRYLSYMPYFEDYYEDRKNIIPNEVRQSLLQKLFRFYSSIFRLLLKKLKEQNFIKNKSDVIIKPKKKYKPNESLTSFSPIQELGIWLPFDKNKNYETVIDQKYKIDNICGYFFHLLRNFKDIFKPQIISLCLENKDIWKNVQEDIADISITISTLIEMFSENDLIDEAKLMNSFEYHLEKQEIYTHPAYLRLLLFQYMKNEYKEHNKGNLAKLEKLENDFNKIDNLEGIKGALETLFAICIVNYTENKDLKIFEDIFKNRIMVILNKLKDNTTYNTDKQEKEKFITIFQSKVKYKYLKYKIKLDILDKEDLLELEEILLYFKKFKCFFYIIKTCFLISEYHLQKMKYVKEDNKRKEKFEHLSYLNFALYLSFIYLYNTSKRKYIDYCRSYIETKFKLKEREKNEKIKERIPSAARRRIR